MRMGMRRAMVFAGVLGLVAAGAGLAEAQTQVDLVTEDFTVDPGWTYGGLWAVDGDPLSGRSPTNSLNYNDGLDYNTGVTNSGTAQTATYTLTGLDTPVLEFYSLFSTEDASVMPGSNRANNHDTRVVRIYSSGAILRYEAQLLNQNAFTDPSLGLANEFWEIPMAWNFRSIPLDPAWGDIYVEFTFDTVDDQFNTDQGWFIDDFRIYYTDPGGGGTTPPPGYDGPGYYDPNGVWIGFPNGDALNPPTAPVGTPPGTEPGSLDPASGVYIGTEGSPAGSGGEGDEGICGLIGLEFLLPLALIGLARRRRR